MIYFILLLLMMVVNGVDGIREMYTNYEILNNIESIKYINHLQITHKKIVSTDLKRQFFSNKITYINDNRSFNVYKFY